MDTVKNAVGKAVNKVKKILFRELFNCRTHTVNFLFNKMLNSLTYQS